MLKIHGIHCYNKGIYCYKYMKDTYYKYMEDINITS